MSDQKPTNQKGEDAQMAFKGDVKTIQLLSSSGVAAQQRRWLLQGHSGNKN